MSLRSKVWVTVGLLCASMAAQAEYKEVWNPPEAARGAAHAHHAKAAAPHAKVTAKPIASAKTKSTAKKPHSVAVKTAHAASASNAKVVHVKAAKSTKAVEAAAKPPQVAASPAVQPGNGSMPRELPPILH
ncbi:MAG TPA: hypothetical protein VN289_14645 [Paraburkholderia sp.]|nr:hypothetical protein [Paraburkholderia sp.]